MAYSQNGWRANTDSLIGRYTVPGTQVKVALRKGDVSVILLYVLEQFNRTVQPLRQSDTGGYAKRVIRGGVSLSNHASGTAVDARWRDHPLGAKNTFTSSQVRAIKSILAFCDGVVRWGGNYSGRKDEMHFEIIGSPSAVARVADKIRNRNRAEPVALKVTTPSSKTSKGPRYPGRLLKRGLMNSSAVRTFQAQLKRRGWTISADGDFGPQTEAVVKAFQKEKRLGVDGIVGPRTWAAIWNAPVTK